MTSPTADTVCRSSPPNAAAVSKGTGLRDLRPSLTVLDLYTNGIASVPTEIAPLTGLQDLTLALNLNGLTGFPMGTPHHVPDLRPVALLRLVQERGLLRERGRLQLRQSRGWHLRLHL